MRLQRYYEVSQAVDLAAFRKYLSDMVGDMGFGLFSAFIVLENTPDKKGIIARSVDNIPPALSAVLNNREFAARDPLIRRLKTQSVPVAYDQSLYIGEGAGDIWETQASYGYKTGISVALHLPNRQHFILGVDRDTSLPMAGDQISRIMADLQLLAVHAQASASRLLLPLMKSETPELSTRELEVLKWTQAGKTAWEIGQILSLSESGVNYHLRSILMKLDAVNKHQAVLKALAQGLIEP